jgi:hypothetical protein
MPDDIPYPVDLRLLNVGGAFSGGVAREPREIVIDVLFKQVSDKRIGRPAAIVRRQGICSLQSSRRKSPGSQKFAKPRGFN